MVYMCIFIHSSVSGHLGCFRVLAVVNSAAVTSGLHVSFSILVSSGYMPAAAAAAKSPQSCPTLCDPIDSSPPGSPVPGILQARTLEWGVLAFSGICLGVGFLGHMVVLFLVF